MAYFLLEMGQLSPGQTVLIPSAAGGAGSLTVQIAKLEGAGKVIGLVSPSKHDFAHSARTPYLITRSPAGRPPES